MSTSFVYTQMARVASFFSRPQVTRLEAEVSQLRERLHSEMKLLPIVKSTDAGGLTCEFMFPVARVSQPASATAAPSPVAVSHDVEGVDVVEVGQHARTEDPQDCVSSEDIKEACGHTFDDRDFCISASPSEEDDDWYWYGEPSVEDVARDREEEIERFRLRGCNAASATEKGFKDERAGIG